MRKIFILIVCFMFLLSCNNWNVTEKSPLIITKDLRVDINAIVSDNQTINREAEWYLLNINNVIVLLWNRETDMTIAVMISTGKIISTKKSEIVYIHEDDYTGNKYWER